MLHGEFPYSEIPGRLSQSTAVRYRDRALVKFVTLAKSWDDLANTEWLVRFYFAAKLILASSLKLTSEEYTTTRRVHVARPYLIYYGLFHACRAFLVTVPFQQWEAGALLHRSHKRVGLLVENELASIDGQLALFISTKLADARALRELFSYTFPGEGPESIRSVPPVLGAEATNIARFLCELAQLNSECLDEALDRHLKAPVGYSKAMASEFSMFRTSDGRTIVDHEDAYRIAQLMRNHARPINLWAQTAEGMVEDFTANWGAGSKSDPNDFDADEAWHSGVFPFL